MSEKYKLRNPVSINFVTPIEVTRYKRAPVCGLMLGAAAATIFAAPAVLTGIALYGVGDYFFDFSGGIDNTIGRNSGVWKP
ncbi:MAG TPA: hypothetical protein PLI68_14675 [Bacteroidia bacterium]|nr:hypothetical protein [Bacteroidia bacterium]